MPKQVLYRAGAIIYFEGDKAETIPILKEGHVEISFRDPSTRQEVREAINTGEFFGVKAALGNYAHDESALALTNSTVVHFSVPEFEEMAAGNPRIIMKMLQVFSTQLRRIHNQVQSLIADDAVLTPETGLFAVGEYYLAEGDYSHAEHAFKRYLSYWPQGIYAPQAALKAQEAEVAKQQQISSSPSSSLPQKKSSVDLTLYEESLSLYQNGKYKKALQGFMTFREDSGDSPYTALAELYLGSCLFYVEKYAESLQQITQVIQTYPQHPRLEEALYFMGMNQRALGDEAKAESFFKKALSLVSSGSSSYQLIQKALKEKKKEDA